MMACPFYLNRSGFVTLKGLPVCQGLWQTCTRGNMYVHGTHAGGTAITLKIGSQLDACAVRQAGS